WCWWTRRSAAGACWTCSSATRCRGSADKEDAMGSDLVKELVDALADAHAMEKQSLTTLRAAVKVAGDPQLEALYHGHIVETERHLELIEERLEAHEAGRSLIKDLAGRVSALALATGVVAQ